MELYLITDTNLKMEIATFVARNSDFELITINHPKLVF